MTLVGETCAQEENRVELGATKDRFGFPEAKMVHTFSPDAHKLLDHTMKEGRAVFEAARAEKIWHGNPGTMHIMGGTVMGEDPLRSVSNGDRRVHDVENLFIGGCGLFPSTGGVNPTFMLSAVADPHGGVHSHPLGQPCGGRRMISITH